MPCSEFNFHDLVVPAEVPGDQEDRVGKADLVAVSAQVPEDRVDQVADRVAVRDLTRHKCAISTRFRSL
jgi:phage-related minor tail protein